MKLGRKFWIKFEQWKQDLNWQKKQRMATATQGQQGHLFIQRHDTEQLRNPVAYHLSNTFIRASNQISPLLSALLFDSLIDL